jgi:hypothetical protein
MKDLMENLSQAMGSNQEEEEDLVKKEDAAKEVKFNKKFKRLKKSKKAKADEAARSGLKGPTPEKPQTGAV